MKLPTALPPTCCNRTPIAIPPNGPKELSTPPRGVAPRRLLIAEVAIIVACDCMVAVGFKTALIVLGSKAMPLDNPEYRLIDWLIAAVDNAGAFLRMPECALYIPAVSMIDGPITPNDIPRAAADKMSPPLL